MGYLRDKSRETLLIFWELARIVVPVMVIAKILLETGVIAAVSPAVAPLMWLYGLPPELAFVLLVAALVGLWNAAVLLFVLVPVGDLSVAQVTVFACLALGVHALPIEQPIIRRAGPSLTVTTVLRILGALAFAGLVHAVLSATGWLSEPVAPRWVPVAGDTSWGAFLVDTAWALLVMFAILVALVAVVEAMRASGLLGWLHRALAPILSLGGIKGEALHLTAIGLLLGIAFGGGLLIREARAGHIPPRQVFLSCTFMGFAHGVIEDTALVVALGADLWAVLVARIVFALAATALIGAVLRRLPDRVAARMAGTA